MSIESFVKNNVREPVRQRIIDACNNDQAATCVILACAWLRNHPDDLYVIHCYAEMLYQMTRYEEAVLVYQDAIERFPDHRWGIWNQLGHLYRYRGDLEQAAAWYQLAVVENPDDATSYIFLGAVQARQGHLELAEQTFRRATKCLEGCVDEAYHNLGLVLRGQGRLMEAKECFEQALVIDDDYHEAVDALRDVITAIEIESSRESDGSQ